MRHNFLLCAAAVLVVIFVVQQTGSVPTGEEIPEKQQRKNAAGSAGKGSKKAVYGKRGRKLRRLRSTTIAAEGAQDSGVRRKSRRLRRPRSTTIDADSAMTGTRKVAARKRVKKWRRVKRTTIADINSKDDLKTQQPQRPEVTYVPVQVDTSVAPRGTETPPTQNTNVTYSASSGAGTEDTDDSLVQHMIDEAERERENPPPPNTPFGGVDLGDMAGSFFGGLASRNNN